MAQPSWLGTGGLPTGPTAAWTNIQRKSKAKTRSLQSLLARSRAKRPHRNPGTGRGSDRSAGDKHEHGAEEKHELGLRLTTLQTDARRVGPVALRAEGRRH